MSNAINGDHSTYTLVISARILRIVTPDTFASMLFVYNGTTDSQKEVADALNRDQSTVSGYFQSLMLENEPVSLVVKPGLRHTVTSSGQEVISLIDDMARNRRVNLDEIDWGSTNDKERVDSLLSPLCDSRSEAPFFLLNSLGKRSDLSHVHDTPSPVWLDEVVDDVDSRLREIGEETSKKRVRQIADRFAEKGAITLNEDRTQLTLDEKGQEHVYLLDQLTEFVADQIERDDEDGKYTVGTLGTSQSGAAVEDYGVTSSDAPQMNISGGNDQQLLTQQSQVVRQSSVSALSQESVTVLTVFCLRFSDGSGVKSILPLTSMTAGDLVEKGQQIVREYGEDAELVPYRMVQTDEGLYPLTSIESRLEDA